MNRKGTCPSCGAHDDAQAVYEAMMEWQRREREISKGDGFMLVAVGRDTWPALLRVVEAAWREAAK